MTFVQQLSNHNRACSALNHALTLGDDPEVWDCMTLVFGVRLTATERACILASIAQTMPPDDVLAVLGSLGAASPLPVFDEVEDDARWWADLASPSEIKAWLVACYARLPMREQRAFLEAAMGRAAA
ncbi:hypothetical protein HKCCSP123_02005 [Rhodobacterales bacterium HKCCSP123]|nr:hypothetical protein [Rhodobacterales bacterium HKCCSP123]